MEAEIFVNEDVQSNGLCGKDGEEGAVFTKGHIAESEDGGGCSIENCECSEGHWFSVIFPLDINKKVRGVCVKFDNRQEKEIYKKLLKKHFSTNKSALLYQKLHLEEELNQNTIYMKEAHAKIKKFESNIAQIKSKITEHWLQTAYSRLKAGDNEKDVMRDYGYVKKA